MKPYLETMQVDPTAVQAHEKGDLETDTFHTIEWLPRQQLRIIKRSRVNNDLTLNLKLGQEWLQICQPDGPTTKDRTKSYLATSDHPGHLKIQSRLQTMSNGVAHVTDLKRVEEGILHQELTITNEDTHKTHTILRHFLPYDKTPPHLVSN